MNTKIESFIGIADIVSLLNLTSGFLSILMSINSHFTLAAILMIAALIFDSCDGWVARKTKHNDNFNFGKNIDSLSDLISFGIAPAIFLYSLGNPEFEIYTSVISLFIVVCGLLRLARYNIISDKVKTFIGYPIPGIAIILSSFYLTGYFNIYITYILAFTVSLMMISNVEYPKFSNKIIISVNCICILLIILQLFTNYAAFIVLVSCIYYLISPLFSKI